MRGLKSSFTEFLSLPRKRGTKMLKLDDQIWTYTPATDRTNSDFGAYVEGSPWNGFPICRTKIFWKIPPCGGSTTQQWWAKGRHRPTVLGSGSHIQGGGCADINQEKYGLTGTFSGDGRKDRVSPRSGKTPEDNSW